MTPDGNCQAAETESRDLVSRLPSSVPVLRDLASPGSPPVGGSVRRFAPQLPTSVFGLSASN